MVNNDENDEIKKFKSVALNQVKNINDTPDDNSSKESSASTIVKNFSTNTTISKNFPEIKKKVAELGKEVAEIKEKFNKRTFDIWTLMISIMLALISGIAITVFTNTFRYIEKIEDNRMDIIHIQKQISTNSQQNPIDNKITSQKQKNTKIQ